MIFDILLVLFIALIAYWGKRRGLVYSLLSFASVIMAYIASALLSKPLAQAFANTEIYTSTLAKLNDMALQNPNIKSHPLLSGFIAENGSLLADKAAIFIVSIITSVLVFFVSLIIFKLVAKMLNSIFKLPVLNFLNSAGGLILGMVEGFMLTYIILAVWGVFTTLETPAQICDSTLLKSMFENNLLFLFFV